MDCKLIQTTTKDEIVLNGLYKEADKDKPITILIHGFTSDFYSYKFFHSIQEELHKHKLASCAIQTRGTGIRTNFVFNGQDKEKIIGSFYELLEEAHLDITAWIEALTKLGYKKFILAGHSLGTYKAVRYLFEGKYKDEISSLVLLAPFDKNGDRERVTNGQWNKHLEEAEKMIKEGKGEEAIPNYFDDYPISYQNYASWYRKTPLNQIWDFYKNENYNGDILKRIKIPVQIIAGGTDDYFYISEYSTIESVKEILKKTISKVEIRVIKGAGHSFFEFEDDVARSVKDFVIL